VNYAKYFALAGLEAKVKFEDAPGAYLGANFRARGTELVVTSVDAGSPAEAAGLRVDDAIAETAQSLSGALNGKKPGDTLKLRGAREIEVTLGKNAKRTWTIQKSARGGELESAILNDWLRSRQ
jgi:predicted metalloprotease with PDZ domain